MSAGAFPRLFEPIAIGPLRLKNRIAMLPHGSGMMREGSGTAEDDAYVEERAAGGAGLLICGGMIVHPTGVRRARKNIEAFDEQRVETLRSKAAIVHRHGVPVIGQLWHTGREMLGEEFVEHAIGPSPVRSPRDVYPPHEMDTGDIREIVRSFAGTAHRLQRAGFDGVEIHGAHGYLVAQFLSPAANFRTDAYGGDEQRRMRFLVEVIEAIRIACGRDFALGLRMTADEEIANGLEVPDVARIAKHVASLDAVDYLSITIGVRGAYVKDITWPEAPAARAAKTIREAAGLPLIIGQRITSPARAESLLVDGNADVIGLARALIADPEWPRKAEAGDVAAIRPCIGLLQDCRHHSPHLHCAASPRTGRETRIEFRRDFRTPKQRRIAVVGGGPAGMEAARTLAERGHAPVLFEAGDGLGGQFLYAASLPKRAGLTALLDHLRSELRRHEVRVELGTRIDTLADLGGAGVFDAAIVATGAVANPVPANDAHPPGMVMSWFDVLERGVPAPHGKGTAAIVDDGGGFWFTYGVADLLAQSGWRIVVVTPGISAIANIPQESTGSLLARLARGSVQFRVLSSVAEIVPSALRIASNASGEEDSIACELVVLQTGRRVQPGPVDALRAAGLQVEVAGDCIAPRRISHALYEAHKAAHALERIATR